jgi:hypothetical protein
MDESDQAVLEEPYKPLYGLWHAKPVLVKQYDKIPALCAEI